MKHKCYRKYKGPGTGHCSDNPCNCDCHPCLEFKRIQALPDLTDEDLKNVYNWCEETSSGPWESTQLRGFGANNFIVSLNQKQEWNFIVAQLHSPGSFDGMKFIAWCKDGVPRLLRMIDQLQQEIKELKK